MLKFNKGFYLGTYNISEFFSYLTVYSYYLKSAKNISIKHNIGMKSQNIPQNT